METELKIGSEQNLPTQDFQKVFSRVISFEDVCLKQKQAVTATIEVGLKKVKKTSYSNKSILSNLSGIFPSGLNAILGCSGSGKTSLLNALAKRIQNTNETKISGCIKVNQMEYSHYEFNTFAAYVMQNDYLLPSLTVRECIQFSADMKLALSNQEKTQKVNRLISQLGLTHCENTLIGDFLSHRISGGERKRVSIALELIQEPQVLLLDEPTSGLDSFTSYKLIQILKNLAVQNNRTIIFTIHQPSSDIWNLFDRVFLMAQGSFVYQGPRSEIIDYFQNFGFSCPVHSNPADYYLEQMNSKEESKLEKMKSQYNMLLKDYILSQVQESSAARHSSLAFQKMSRTTFLHTEAVIYEDIAFSNFQSLNRVSAFYKFKKLLKRQFIVSKRTKMFFFARIFQTIFMGLFMGAIFWNVMQVSSFESSDQSLKIGKAIYLISLGIFNGSMNPQVNSFLQQRVVYLREEGSKLYTLQLFYLCKLLPEICICTLFSFLNILFIFFMLGFKFEIHSFLFFVFVYSIQANLGNAFGVLSACIFKDSKVGITFSLSFITPQILFGGVFKNLNLIPNWISWMKYITPTMYTFDALTRNEFETTSQMQYNPTQLLDLNLNKWFSTGMLLVLFCMFHIMAFSFLYHKRQRLQ